MQFHRVETIQETNSLVSLAYIHKSDGEQDDKIKNEEDRKKEGRKKALSLLVNFVYLYGNYYHFMSFLSCVNPTTTFLWLEVTFLFKSDAKCFLAV